MKHGEFLNEKVKCYQLIHLLMYQDRVEGEREGKKQSKD